ncbi:MAG: DUF4349 domain-containing protein [Actinomycetota bacterium]
MTKRKVIGAAVLVVGLVLAAGAVGKFATSNGSGDSSSLPAQQMNREVAQADDGRAGSGGAGGDGAGGPAAGGSGSYASATDAVGEGPALSAVPVPGSTRVIKNANLQVEVQEGDFQRQFSRATAVAEDFGGFVSSSRVSEDDDELHSGSVTIRVPSDRFDAAVERLRELGQVTAEERSGRDVTREFVDLQARLRQAQTEEGFFVRLLDEAESISDLIQIQSQLSDVQLRIEQLQGQLNYMEDQTEFSTITARIYEPGAEDDRPVEGLAQAWARAVDGFQTVVAGAIISLGWLAPLALLGALVFGAYRLTGRRGATRREVQVTADEDPKESKSG